MSELHNDLTEIKQTLHVMQEKIDVLEFKLSNVNPQCFDADMPLSLSAAKSMWPMLEKEFDEYCDKHNITVWTSDDNTNFYNEYVRYWRRLAKWLTKYNIH